MSNANNNLEDEFRSKFNNEPISNEGWNDPSDAVWNNIETDLDRPDKRERGYGFYMLLSGFLISLLSLGYMYNQNQSLHDDLDKIRIELDECGTPDNTTTLTPKVKSMSLESAPESISLNKIQSNNILFKDVNKQSVMPVNSSKASLPIMDNDPERNFLSVSNLPGIQLYPETSERYNDKFFNGAESNFTNETLMHDNRDNVNLVPLVRNLGKLKSSTFEASKDLISSKSPEIVKPISEKLPASIFSISAGIINGNLLNKGTQENTLTELIDNEYAKAGYSIEVNYRLPLTRKISLSIGAGLSQQKFITAYDLTLPYDVSNELVSDGRGFIDFQHSLPTSFGNTDTEVTLVRSSIDQPLDEGDVSLDYNTEHRLSSVFLPISADYHFGNIVSGFSVGVDVIPSYIVIARSGISSVISHHSEVQAINNSSFSEYDALNRLNLGLGMHAAYRYALSEKAGIEVNARYFRNVSNYFDTDSFSSTSESVQIGAGYYFRF